MLERPFGRDRTKVQSSMTDDHDCSLRRAMARFVYKAAFLESAMILRVLFSIEHQPRRTVAGLRLGVEGFSCGVVAFLEVKVALCFEV